MTLELVTENLATDEEGLEWERDREGRWVKRGTATRPKPPVKKRKKEYASPERIFIESRRPPPAPLETYRPAPYEPGEAKARREELRKRIDAAARQRAKRSRTASMRLEREYG